MRATLNIQHPPQQPNIPNAKINTPTKIKARAPSSANARDLEKKQSTAFRINYSYYAIS